MIVWQKSDLTVANARITSTEYIGEENKENNPSETAVLQQTVSRLNTELHEIRDIVSSKDAEINNLNTQCSHIQAKLDEVVSWEIFL